MRLDLVTALLALWMGTASAAQDYLVSTGPLSDRDFYRMVACRAMPGKPCADRMVRWSKEEAMALGVGLAAIPQGYPDPLARQVDRGIDLAIEAINAAGGAVRMTRVTSSAEADIRIHLINARQGQRITGTGNREMDGTEIGAALVHIRWNLAGEITQGTIAIARDLPLRDAFPVLLEEMTQSLGLMTDIRNPYYEGLSVFSEDSNDVTKFSDQDRMAIRSHYPPADP